MRWLVESSLQFRILVVVAAGVIVFFGIQQLDNSVGLRQYIGMTSSPDAGIDHLPEYSPPFVEVQTEALGLSAEEVEALITTPLGSGHAKRSTVAGRDSFGIVARTVVDCNDLSTRH